VTFDRGDRPPDIGQSDLTGAHGFAVDMDCASAAGGDAAAELGASEADFVPQNPKEGDIIGEIYLVIGAIDRKGSGHCCLRFFFVAANA